MSTGDRISAGRDRGIRRVTDAGVGLVTELFVLAFHEDPTWSWAFPNPEKRAEQYRALWSLYLHSALPFGWVWTTEDEGAASLWILPGVPSSAPKTRPATSRWCGTCSEPAPMTSWRWWIGSRRTIPVRSLTTT